MFSGVWVVSIVWYVRCGMDVCENVCVGVGVIMGVREGAREREGVDVGIGVVMVTVGLLLPVGPDLGTGFPPLVILA